MAAKRERTKTCANLRFRSAVELQKKIDEYFNECDANKSTYTITGFAYFLGFATRGSIYDYINKNKSKEMSFVVKRAKTRIEASIEARLIDKNSIGAMFWLKNHDWSDVQKVEHSGDVNINIKGLAKL
ncbi:MAG TPA: terminase small subunit [Ignavibacteriaceae bacterium]|nr:terminase small subunit [Ignavibacteriaceae bacterium]